MLEELQRRNYSEKTIRGYLRAVEQFAGHFGKSPDKLGPDELRSYQAYLLTGRKQAVGSVVGRVAALRFFFVRTLKRREFWEELPYAKDSKDRRRLPTPERVSGLLPAPVRRVETRLGDFGANRAVGTGRFTTFSIMGPPSHAFDKAI
jgi:integrase/recombinase XerD